MIRLEETTFNGSGQEMSNFSSGQDRMLSGAVKVEDKASSDPNFISFNYYKLGGNFHLSSSKENVKTGDIIKSYFIMER